MNGHHAKHWTDQRLPPVAVSSHCSGEIATHVKSHQQTERRASVESATVELMATNHLTPTALAAGGVGPGTGHGLGVAVLVNAAENGNIGSVGGFGWSGAASTHLFIDPKEDLVAIYCTQLMGGDSNLRTHFQTMVCQSIVGN